MWPVRVRGNHDVESPNGAAEFTPTTTRVMLVEACNLVGIDPNEAELIRLGENAIYRLSDTPLIVRIARSREMLDDVRKEMRVARWLAIEDYPAARLATDLHDGDSPLLVDSHPVTFWEFIDSVKEPRPNSADLGRQLRRLHGLATPEWLALPPFQPFARVEKRLDCPPAEVPREDVDFLRSRLEHLKDAAVNLDYQFPPGQSTGTRNPKNPLRRRVGDVVLLTSRRSAGVRRNGISV
jgi:hypothetical protein